MSPELLNGLPYGPKVNVCSMDATIANIFLGVHPFHPVDENNYRSRLFNGPVQHKSLYLEIATLLTNILATSPTERFSIRQVKSAQVP